MDCLIKREISLEKDFSMWHLYSHRRREGFYEQLLNKLFIRKDISVKKYCLCKVEEELNYGHKILYEEKEKYNNLFYLLRQYSRQDNENLVGIIYAYDKLITKYNIEIKKELYSPLKVEYNPIVFASLFIKKNSSIITNNNENIFDFMKLCLIKELNLYIITDHYGEGIFAYKIDKISDFLGKMEYYTNYYNKDKEERMQKAVDNHPLNKR